VENHCEGIIMAVKTIQISANISVETKALLEKYAEVQGVKKAVLVHGVKKLREKQHLIW
jgi:predicted ATP-grasp superfamily ATP-dependent carboligase